MAVKNQVIQFRIPPEYALHVVEEVLREIGSFKGYTDDGYTLIATDSYMFQKVDINIYVEKKYRSSQLEIITATDDIIGTGASKAIKKFEKALDIHVKNFEPFYKLEETLGLLYKGEVNTAKSIVDSLKAIPGHSKFLASLCEGFITLLRSSSEDGTNILLNKLSETKNLRNYLKVAFIAFKLGHFKASAAVLLAHKERVQRQDTNIQDFLLLQLILSGEIGAFASQAISDFPQNLERLSHVFDNERLFQKKSGEFKHAVHALHTALKGQIKASTSIPSIDYLNSKGEETLPQYYEAHHQYLLSGEIDNYNLFKQSFNNFLEVIRQADELASELLMEENRLLFLSVSELLKQIFKIQNSKFDFDGKWLYSEISIKTTQTIEKIDQSITFGQLNSNVDLLRKQYSLIQGLETEFRTRLSGHIKASLESIDISELQGLIALYREMLPIDKYSFGFEIHTVTSRRRKIKLLKQRLLVIGVAVLTCAVVFFGSKTNQLQEFETESTVEVQTFFTESNKEYGIISDHEDYSNMRLGPSVEYDVYKKLTARDTFFIEARYPSNWYGIQLADSTKGYIHGSRIDVLTDEYFSLVLATFEMESQALNQIKVFSKRNIKADLVFMPNYTSLSNEPLYAVITGVYLSAEECESELKKIKKDHANSYGVLISNYKSSKIIQVEYEPTSFFAGMSKSSVLRYAEGALTRFAVLIQEEDLIGFSDLFMPKMRVYHDYKNTSLSTITKKISSDYFSKWNVIQDSVYSVSPIKGGYHFEYKKFYKIQSKVNPKDERIYDITGRIKFDRSTGKIIEIDDVSTKRIDNEKIPEANAALNDTKPKRSIFKLEEVDVIPVFESCVKLKNDNRKLKCFEKSIRKYVSKTVNTKKKNYKSNEVIRVTINFNELGLVESAFLLQGVEYYLDQQVLSAVKALPKCIPATKNGSPVRVTHTIELNPRKL